MQRRINLLTKLLTILLFLTVVPLAIVGYLALEDAQNLGYKALDDAKDLGKKALKESRDMGNNALEKAEMMGDTAIEDATDALNNLGAEMIKQEAKLVAKQLEIYIKENPDMTVEDLQNDPYFQEIAVQPVGETGYTAITDYDTLTCRWHVNPAVANLDLSKLAEKLPGFWGIMSQTKGGVDADGFYDWAEADGSINEKYMYIAVVNKSVRTADGVGFHVAATTYIDEFNQPVKDIRQKISSSVAEAREDIKESNEKTENTIQSATDKTERTIQIATEGISTQNKIFMVTAITILIVLIVGIIFARSITTPVQQLTRTANRVVAGDLDAKINVSSNDEIKDLAQAMEALVGAVKFFRRGEKK